MRFLGDESCDFRVIRALRGAGHDVSAVAELRPGGPDEEVVDLAIREDRIFVTEDRDFGQLVFAAARHAASVIYVRYPMKARATLADDILRLVAEHQDKLVGRFVVLQPGRIRFTEPPPGDERN